MLSEEIIAFKTKVEENPEYHKIRRSFVENYEYLESFWQMKFGRGDSLNQFTKKYGCYFAYNKDIQSNAFEIAKMNPVKNSNTNFERASQNVELATNDISNFSKKGEFKSERFDNSFSALFEIIKQVRNNLFHGRKTDLEETQFQRNKKLIILSNNVLENILHLLPEAEKNCG